jgi:hypothetical protein
MTHHREGCERLARRHEQHGRLGQLGRHRLVGVRVRLRVRVGVRVRVRVRDRVRVRVRVS